MAGWVTFWKIACIIGFGSFFVLVLFVIPLGAKDLLTLLGHLGRGEDR